MKDSLVAGLQPLVGLPLWAIGRAGSLEWFEFGGPERMTDRRGETRDVGAYALHVDCEWRLLGPDGMIWGSDESTGEHLARLASPPLMCAAVAADDSGSIRLTFADGARLVVRPEDPQAEEYWRLLQPARETRHLVVGAAGIER